jgi:hypothetical protein
MLRRGFIPAPLAVLILALLQPPFTFVGVARPKTGPCSFACATLGKPMSTATIATPRLKSMIPLSRICAERGFLSPRSAMKLPFHHFLATAAARVLISSTVGICAVSYGNLAAALGVRAAINLSLFESHFVLLSHPG